MKVILIELVSMIHIMASFIMYTFWLFLPKEYLKHYAIFMLLLVAHWYVIDNRCILTVIEYKLKNKDITLIYRDTAPYVKDMCHKIGIEIDEKLVVYLMTIIAHTITIFTICRINMEK